ncbi:NADH:flavin oxidoreductase/NADH oxidase family protein [Exidia glandulosa HHB12029]|uniref:NADH:flavin oxidoreductase/NADH oxidase family protein n=1 Tax=Exidia glandulosa HHB12029 TaxID=1314781 RepID=A0A166BQ29_EXIGL|nr:NADH:flavin oxidoreductase/NADH oxidase family protein [Exidia glandulosa HHB12029]
MSTPSTAPLFEPVRVGDLTLQHRVAMAPLTRMRGDDNHVPSPHAAEYYAQRASTPGTLLISEATFIAERAGGYKGVPGIYSEAQIEAWKKITDAVHAKGSFIYCQLWALGRTAIRAYLPAQYDVVSSGDITLVGSIRNPSGTKPRPLTIKEIDEYVESYVQAARNALRAGFDGVEIHSANGYLLDQFLQTNSNNRTDEYGGSVENRIRFTLRVAQAVSQAIGPEKTGLRLSPYERFQGMYMPESDLRPTFSAIIARLADLKLAYLHLTEPRVSGQLETRIDDAPGLPESLDWAAEIWRSSGNPIVLAGGYLPDTATKRVLAGKERGEEVIIAFGRYFISNPDLPERIRKGVAFTPYYRPTFYGADNGTKGYTDYPFANDVAAGRAITPSML